MLEIRRSEDRGHVESDWLDTHHTFSFGSYHDPKHLGFRALRVINDDRIAPARGFGMHPHQDMEILSYVVEGSLRHHDNMGNGSTIRPGDVQRVSAGKGVLHSEMNPSASEDVRLLQIWILPDHLGTAPSYEERHFEAAERAGRLRIVASKGGRDESVSIDADVSLYAGLLAPGDRADLELAAGRYAWVQVVSGELDAEVGEGVTRLRAGDGAAISNEAFLRLEAIKESEVLVFDLA